MTWDDYFVSLCDAVKAKSKDPSTKVGAVVVRPDRTVVSTGWNGFPRGVEDRPDRYADRPTKYRFTCHAEANAIVSARQNLDGCTLYCTLPPCEECAKLIIQAGIRQVVCPRPTRETQARWSESFLVAGTMFVEAGVKITYPRYHP